METIENINTWRGLLVLLIFLFLFYWVVKVLTYGIANYTKKNVTHKKVVSFLERLLLLFKPIAVLLLLLDFITINPISHTILLAVVGVLGHKHIHNYINGIILKINPLIDVGALLETGKHQGEIKQLLPLGMLLRTETGERFLSYSEVETKGFAVKSYENSSLRQILFLKTEVKRDAILDLLFDNPILNYKDQPSLKATEKANEYKLQYSLENGASSEDLIAFLIERNISSNKSINTSN